MSGYEYVLERLAQFRKGMNLTQLQVAEKLGISQEQFSYFETGKVKITAEILVKLAALGFDINYIITGELYREPEDRTVSKIFDNLCENERKNEYRCLFCCLLCLFGETSRDAKTKNQRLVEYLDKHHNDFSMICFVRDELNINQIPLANELGLSVKKLRRLEKGEIYPDAEVLYELCQRSEYSPLLFLDICDREMLIMELFWNEITKECREKLCDVFMNVCKMIDNI